MSKNLLILGFGELFEIVSLQFPQLQPLRKIEAVETGASQDEELNDDVFKRYEPENWDVFAAVGVVDMSFMRLELFSCAKKMGFKCESFIHPSAVIDPTANIGQNCYIGENTVVAPRARIDYNTCIGTRSNVGYNSHIGSSVWIGSGCVIGSSSHIGSHSIIGEGAMVSDSVKIGKLCSLQIARRYSEDVPDRSYHHPLFDEPVRIYG